MRIIGGAWRGRQIAVPPTETVRPTGDRVREAWLSIVQFDVPGARVIDLCAGSGALGIEALSRGAAHVTFVDESAPVLATLRKNLASLGADPARYTILRGDAVAVARGLSAGEFSLGFADPPYASPVAETLADIWLSTPFATLLGIEHAESAHLGDGGDRRRYGKTAITFFRA